MAGSLCESAKWGRLRNDPDAVKFREGTGCWGETDGLSSRTVGSGLVSRDGVGEGNRPGHVWLYWRGISTTELMGVGSMEDVIRSAI